MKKTKRIAVILSLLCLLFICSACTLLGLDNERGYVNFIAEVKYDVGFGAVEKQGKMQTVSVGDKAVLRANDTAFYTFSHWEYQNEIVSTEREFVLKPEKEDLNVRRYYAVFTPNDPTRALVNVICDNGETIEESLMGMGRLLVLGGGYYSLGETATLESDVKGVGIARTFSYDNLTVDGPVLNLTVEKNITVRVTLEKMVSVKTANTKFCSLSLQDDDGFLREEDSYRVKAELTDDDFVLDTWYIKDARTGKILEERNWEENVTLELPVTSRDVSLYNQIMIELTGRNDNLKPTLPVNILSTTGDPVHIDVRKPEKMISGRGFPLWITPDENTYMQEITILEPPTEYMQYPNTVSFHGVEEIYATGGEVYVPDWTSGKEGYSVEIKAISREKSAFVRIISDDDFVQRVSDKTGILPNGYVAPKLGTEFLIVEKNKEHRFYPKYYESLRAIYEVGCQFSAIVDEHYRKVADNLAFSFTVNENTNYYIKWTEKPVFDEYFDYTLTQDKSGYVAKLSQLTAFGRWPALGIVEEVALPYSYNGKPVKEIAEFGMSQYRLYPEETWAEEYQYLPFKKIILPYTLKKIGAKAFAGCTVLQVVIPQGHRLSYVSPDAFWSPNGVIKVNLSKQDLHWILKALHDTYVSEKTTFSLAWNGDSHFGDGNEIAHYEAWSPQFICVKESAYGSEVSSKELGAIYREFFRYYQAVALKGVGKESLETMKIKPSQEELESWSLPNGGTGQGTSEEHPKEISAREFAKTWSGWQF